MFDGAMVKELKKQAELIGGLYGKAHLGDISMRDLYDVVDNPEIQANLRKAYADAVGEVGEKKAMKVAISTTRNWAQAYARQGRTSYGNTLRAAEIGIRKILTSAG